MLTLVKLAFVHYSPKDSEDGVKAFLIVDSDDCLVPVASSRLIAYIKENCIFSLDDYAEDEDGVYLSSDWIASHPNAVDRAKEAGLKVKTKYGLTEVEGNKRDIILALQGNTAFEVEEAYYGVTQYDWSDLRQITDAEAEMLVNLGIATRI